MTEVPEIKTAGQAPRPAKVIVVGDHASKPGRYLNARVAPADGGGLEVWQHGELTVIYASGAWQRVRIESAEPAPDLLALVDKATRDHADVGLPGEIRRANANRAAAGLGPLPVPGGEITFTPIGYQGPAQHTYTTGCDGFHEPGQCPRIDRIEADGCECGSPDCRRGPAPVSADADL